MMADDDKNAKPKLRTFILNSLREKGLGADDAESLLQQCADYLRDVQLVKRLAVEIGIKLVKYLNKDELEFYYDIIKEDRNIGFISKGWDDPGFRLGENLKIPPDRLSAFRKHGQDIIKLCATNGTPYTTEVTAAGLSLCLNLTLYQDGLNARVLSSALQILEYCVFTIHKMLAEPAEGQEDFARN